MTLKKVGALWRHTKDDKDFYSGTIDFGVLGKGNIYIFHNEKKKTPNELDATLYIQFEEREKPCAKGHTPRKSAKS
jgi:hypothetical protein